MPDTDGLTPQIKDDSEKTFSFSGEEKQFLEPRQMMINQYMLAASDIEFVMKQFLTNNVCKRLAIDPTNKEIVFNIFTGTLTVKNKAPEQAAPPSPDIILPK